MSDSAGRRLRQLGDVAVTQLRHVGEKRAGALASLGIENVFDLLTVYPRRYIDRTKRVDLSDLTVGEEAAIFGEVKKVSSRRTKQGKVMVEVTVADNGGAIKVVFSGVETKSAPIAFAWRMSSEAMRILSATSSEERSCTQAARKTLMRSIAQERIELAFAVERIEIVATADMHIADKDLRHGPAAARFRFHFLPRVAVHEHVYLFDGGALFLQERLGPGAVRTNGCGIDPDAVHLGDALRRLGSTVYTLSHI